MHQPSGDDTRARGIRAAISTLALALAAIVVVVLATQKRALERDLRRANAEAHLPQLGDAVPPMYGVTITGDSVVVGPRDGREDQLLLVLSTSCSYCIRALPEWNRLAAALLKRRGIAVYGLSVDSESVTRAFVQAHSPAFPVLPFPDQRTAAAYRAFATPLTIVLDSSGYVVFAHVGVLDPAVVDSLLAVLGAEPLTHKEGQK